MEEEYEALADLCERYFAGETYNDKNSAIPVNVFVETFARLLLEASTQQLLWIADKLSAHRA